MASATTAGEHDVEAVDAAPLLPTKQEAVIGFYERWGRDPNQVLRDAVTAFSNTNAAEGKAAFLAMMAFLANAPRMPYHEIAQLVAGAALELAIGKPRVDLLEWLDEANLLFQFANLVERVSTCKHPQVAAWFKLKAIRDPDIMRRFIEPVNSLEPTERPFSQVLDKAMLLHGMERPSSLPSGPQ